jgi:hypothetical protein
MTPPDPQHFVPPSANETLQKLRTTKLNPGKPFSASHKHPSTPSANTSPHYETTTLAVTSTHHPIRHAITSHSTVVYSAPPYLNRSHKINT